jgi:hypothetical protein
MPTIYNIDSNRIFTGLTREIEDGEGAPVTWTFSAPPDVPAGKFAWYAFPEWVILDEYPVAPFNEEPKTVEKLVNENPEQPMVV